MKNRSAFLRFPLSEALMILITLVVCLAGITKAEVKANYRKQDPNLQKNENFLMKEASFMKKFPDTRQASEMRGPELREKNFFNLRNFPEYFLDRPKKRQSDYFGDSNDSDSEKESDGYGYDDDEYYHFNYKRHDESNGKIENSKSEKETVDEKKDKESFLFPSNSNHPNQAIQKNEIKKNNDQSIEMLNYQESHPIISQEDRSNPFHNVKPFSNVAHPKPSSTNSMSSLRGIDFKENSAINENSKERKEEAALSNSESKISEVKKGVKANDEKNPSKLQDLKLEENSEKKEKELGLKDEKNSVATKSLKDTSKTSEDKEKAVKLSESAKLNENLEKISSSKSKDNESVKLTRENKDVARFNNKLNSDTFDANGLSQISGGANFVGNDYKDNLDVLKSIRGEGDEKRYEEFQDNEKNVGFNEYTKDAKENQEKFKEKRLNALKGDRVKNFEFLNKQSNLIKALQGTAKPNSYSKVSSNIEFQNANNFFRRREPWRESDKITAKLGGLDYQPGQQYQQQTKQEQMQQAESNSEAQMRHSLANIPPNELENTEYHKNYIKSLKKYKALNDNSKNYTTETGFSMTSGTINLCPKAESKKKRRSKAKKRSSMTAEKSSEGEKKSLNEKSRFRNQKRKAYSGDNFLSDPIEKCLKKAYGSQSLSEIKINKEDTNALDDKNYFDPWNNNRQRRKSPKLEYEIKIINQSPPDLKNAKFSHFISGRLKKDVKTKLGTEDKYLKKYPYSQVSRDELMKMSDMRESGNEKKFKRTASIWKRDDRKSIIQTRAVPSGYYSNRVKFGQRSNLKNNEKGTSDSSNEESNRFSPTFFSQTPSEANKNNFQRGWENKRPNLKHEPAKRFEESQLSNAGNSANSLLLVKKGERLTKVFQEENPSKSANENEINSNRLGKILSEDRNYVFFKEPDGDKFKKNSETGASFSLNLNDLGGSSYANKKSSFLDSSSSRISNNNEWSTPLKSLHVRSSHSEKNDKRFTSAFQNTSPNSNLKKAIDKFRDMADFFKDNEQETTDNRYLNQEAKDGTDIVFSQDKLPDPIIISNEDSNKESGFKPEPVNSIFAISNNFKNSDQQNKKFELPDTKGEISDSMWKPALKQIFPEAKTINSVVRSGNEIIVLDLNGNQLKLDHEHGVNKGPPKEQSRRTTGSSSRVFLINPNQYLTSKKQEFILSDIPLISQYNSNSQTGNQDKIAEKSKMSLISGDRAVAIIRSADNESEIPGSLHEIAELPDILKTIMITVPHETRSSVKSVNRKSLKEASQNYNLFLQNIGKSSQTKTKKETVLSAKDLPEQSVYDDPSMKNLENILQSLLHPASVNFNELTSDGSKSLLDNLKPDQQFYNIAEYQPDVAPKQQNRWFTQERGREYMPFNQGMWVNGLKTNQEINNILKLNSGGLSENNNENKLRKELAAASEKIHRLRREGMEAGKLRKTIEDALAFKETRETDHSKEFSETKEEDKSKKSSSPTVALKLDDKASITQETENTNKLKCQVKEVDETKEGSEADKSSKSDYENHLSELFENLNANKNQKNSNENSWNKKKRMDTGRRKRFSKRDVSNKVSKTEVQNKIVKRLVEDNYRSVYSPGIKRRLLSTSSEMEDADSNTCEHKHVKNFNARKIQEKNAADIDPMIAKLFSVNGSEAEKNRARRSLTTSFHSNFKREIDLDESMPNDFQNFLVTSLGGFGSQKREVVKKGEALWEGKEMSQDNYNQVVENGKDTSGDSALEKREVPSSENQKIQNYKKPVHFSSGNQKPQLADSTSINQGNKNIRSDDSSIIKLRPSKFADEKLPTQIRIQISNTSSKQKKSSKPIMDENETTSTDLENLPKEKEFFDKNKINPLLPKNYLKLRQHPVVTYPEGELDEIMNKNSGFKRKPFRPYWRDERIRKKSTAENSIKSVQDFSKYDQRAIESQLQNQQSNPESDRIAQKVSMITRLPQVETVYNPTQGANKAQIENSRFAKTNTIKNKGSLNTKNNLQSNEGPSYDDGNLKSYFKIEKVKSDKGAAKEYGEPQWKVNLEQDFFGGGSSAMKSPIGESASFSGSNIFPPSSSDSHANTQKWFQGPNGNLLYHGPSNVMSSQVMFDVMKLKQHMKNRNGYEKENYDLKQFSKPSFSYENEAQDNLQKSKSNLPLLPNWLDNPSNYLDFSLGKKPLNDFLENKNYDNIGMKTQNSKDFGTFKHAYSVDETSSKNYFERPSLDATQLNSVDSSKDTDYMDNLEDEYPDVQANKDPQTEDGLYRASPKETNRAHETPSYHHFYNYKHFKNNFKNSELNNNLKDNEKEFDEEYEENGEDEDLDDYSQLGFKKEVEPETTMFSPNGPNLQNGFFRDLNSKYYSHNNRDLKGNGFEDNSNLVIPAEEFKSDVDPFSGSSEILRKANEKSQIFGKNLMKKLYGTPNNEIFSHLGKFRNENSLEDTYHVFGNKLSKRKLNLRRNSGEKYEKPEVGNQEFNGPKFQVSDSRMLTPSKVFLSVNKRMTRHTYSRLPERNPFNAEFAGGENDFDHELKEHGVHLNDNFVSLEKNGISQIEKNFEGLTEKNNRNDEDVEENLEDGGEDNVLENVIGKYIMRKRIKSSTDVNKDSENASKLKDTHKIKKRSVGMQSFGDQAPKVLKKRLSSGHLTENNFRKYHKKNLTKKRHIGNLLSNSFTFTAFIDDNENIIKKGKTKDQMKRSALDIFRKITNKEKDNKRLENSDGRTAGFEPLLSLNDKSKGYVKESKDAISFQEKQLSKDISQTELKSNPPELKAHYPNEGQRLRAQIAERKKGKAKEADQVPLTINAQGPWKVELNDKYDSSDIKKENSFRTFKGEEKAPVSGQNSRYKAFLVISNNVDPAEQNSKATHPAVSGFFHKDSSSSYWPKSDECIRFSINHVQKRSVKSSTNQRVKEDKVAPQASTNYAMKGRATNLKENQDSQFFTKKKLINRKSVFPPSSDSNIIRDSRHINEETSEYHSQRIVDAILSKVSKNSKFKELIAPGLVVRTPTYKEGIDSKSKATNFSEELQSFLQKFMFDFEKLAEQQFRKRMCNHIDKDLKEFLQSLLSIPEGKVKDKLMISQQDQCSLSPHINIPIRRNLSQLNQISLDDIRKEQFIFKKLFENYQSLPKIGKEKLDTKYPHLLQESEQKNEKLKSSEKELCLIPKSTYCESNNTQTNLAYNNADLNNEELQTKNNNSDNAGYLMVKPRKPNIQSFKSNSDENDLKPVTDTGRKKGLAVFFFSPLNCSNQEDKKNATSSSHFEKVITVNDTNIKNQNSNNNNINNNKKSKNQITIEMFEPTNSTLKSSDLLSSQTSIKNPETEVYDSPMKSTGSIRTKHFSSNNERFFKRSESEKKTDPSTQLLTSPKEKRKLSLDYAAGLRLLLKNRGSRVNNVEFGKSMTQAETLFSQPKGGTQLLQKNAMDALSVEDFKTPKISFEYFNDYSDEPERDQIENYNIHKKPRVFRGSNKNIYLPQIKPFVSKRQIDEFNCFKIRPNFFILRPPLTKSLKKQTRIFMNFFNNFCNQPKQYRESKFLKRKIWKKRNMVPRLLTHHPKMLKEKKLKT